MPSPEIEEFAKILVQQVRDAAIQSSDRNLRPDVHHVIAKRWKEAGHRGNVQSIASVLIPDIVDDTVFHLLRAIDQELLQLSFTASNGKVVNLPADGLGELSGWYMGSGGWRALYSAERFVDDFSDLK
ncbi:MAG TPA: hypothetical protein VJW76_03170 [Verrucomicrobiae bacterium]|nr:hypothetical protein [Verrucomicrobiae bacterium]